MWGSGVTCRVAAPPPPPAADRQSRSGAPARLTQRLAAQVLERRGAGGSSSAPPPSSRTSGQRQPSECASSAGSHASPWALPWQRQGRRGQHLLEPQYELQWALSAAGPAEPPAEPWQTAGGTHLAVQQLEPPPRQQPSPSQPQLEQQAGPGSEGPGGGKEEQEFFANVGDAIRTLREDYPLLFVKDLNYSIYRDDLVFKDPNLTFSGLKTYRAIFWGLRFHGKLLLQAAHVRVLRIWQPEDSVIKLRWQINATPRLSGAPGTFDGISIYKLDRKGRVYQHEVTDVQLRDPPITNPLLYGLNFILSPRPQVQQVPCPGSWFVDEEELLLPDNLAAVTIPPLQLPSGSSDSQ